MRLTVLFISLLIAMLFVKVPVGFSSAPIVLTGTVYDNSGKIVAGAIVKFSTKDNSPSLKSLSRITTTNEKGQYSIVGDFEPETYQIQISFTGFQTEPQDIVIPAKGGTITFDAALPFKLGTDPGDLLICQVKGTVKDNKGNIIQSASIDVFLKSDVSFKRKKPQFPANTAPQQHTDSDANGYFEIGGLIKEDYIIFARAQGFKDSYRTVACKERGLIKPPIDFNLLP